MTIITLNKDSWHYRLATEYSKYFERSGNKNFCEYFKHVCWGFVNCCMTSIVAAIVIAALATVAICLYNDIDDKYLQVWSVWYALLYILGIVLYIILGGIVFIFIGCTIENLISEVLRQYVKPRKYTTPPANSFLSVYIKQLKEKVCFNIEFTTKKGK